MFVVVCFGCCLCLLYLFVFVVCVCCLCLLLFVFVVGVVAGLFQKGSSKRVVPKRVSGKL